MFNDYIKSILPIPILDIKVSKTNNYRYKITTHASVADEPQTRMAVENRVKKCKRMKTIEGWYLDGDVSRKYAIVEFVK